MRLAYTCESERSPSCGLTWATHRSEHWGIKPIFRKGFLPQYRVQCRMFDGVFTVIFTQRFWKVGWNPVSGLARSSLPVPAPPSPGGRPRRRALGEQRCGSSPCWSLLPAGRSLPCRATSKLKVMGGFFSPNGQLQYWKVNRNSDKISICFHSLPASLGA